MLRVTKTTKLANLKKPVSRLILLFILMVFIAGVILTFLSINNITNFRILTEKRIQETQLVIASKISKEFNQTIQNVTEEFNREWSSQKLKYHADSLFLQGVPVQAFQTGHEGNFVFPWFMETGQITSTRISGTVQQELTSGEADEYQHDDFGKAFLHYTSALQFSKTVTDSAKVLNALGRITLKLNQPEKTWEYYAILFPRLSGELSQGGVPYSYFAVSQLIKLNLPGRQPETLKIAETFLNQLANSEIPLNPGTKILLDEIMAWISTLNLNKNELRNFHAKMVNVDSKLQFIESYAGKLREIISLARPPELPETGNFSVYGNGNSELQELIIVETKNENSTGFVVSLNNLWKKATNQLPSVTKAEYLIELVPGGNTQVTQDALTTRAELSSYFPMHRILIKPTNEKIVENFVRSRSWIYGIALVLLLGGMCLGIVLILRDIRREKKMADMQSEFVAHVTHELKTPLTSISMFAETIFLDRAKSEEIRKKYANIIMKESEVLKRKIDNILEYSVRKNETTKYRIKETNLTTLVGEVMEEMKYWLDINQFNVKTEIETDVFAKVDPDAIKQALTNLIGNAIKYSPVDKNLVVRLKKNDGKISFEVEDTGIGIPKDQQNLVFEKFYRVRSNENESTTGTGLGLCVTRDIVHAHGGKIFVESEINRGSKFTIQLNS